MDASTRAKVVAAISAGRPNREISGEFSVTVNQVAGVRCRDFGSTMTREAALELGRRNGTRGRETVNRVLRAIPTETTIRRAALLGDVPLSSAQMAKVLNKLIARGAVVREAFGLYRRVSA